MSDAKKTVDPCACNLRKKIILTIAGILGEGEGGCTVPDSELVNALDFELNGPKGQPVLRIRFCPWCGGSVPLEKIARITETEDNDSTEDWKGDGYPNDEDWRGTSGG